MHRAQKPEEIENAVKKIITPPVKVWCQKKKQQKKTNRILPVLAHKRALQNLKTTIVKNWCILLIGSEIQEIFSEPILLKFWRDKNLQELQDSIQIEIKSAITYEKDIQCSVNLNKPIYTINKFTAPVNSITSTLFYHLLKF